MIVFYKKDLTDPTKFVKKKKRKEKNRQALAEKSHWRAASILGPQG